MRRSTLRLTPLLLAALAGLTAPTLSTSSRPNFTSFEVDVFPAWLKQHCGDDLASCAFLPNETGPTAYGVADVLHALSFVGQLDSVPAHVQQRMSEAIAGKQNSSGFYVLTSEENTTGFQPWHATAFMASALYLVHERPRYNNSVYSSLIANPSSWAATFNQLLNVEPGVGCDSIHACAHKIVGIPATVLLQDGGAPAGDDATFLDWWFSWAASNVDVATGSLCPPQQKKEHGLGVCLGSGAAIHFLFSFTGHLPWPYANSSRQFSLSQQGRDGMWSRPTSWLNLDGVFQATRSNTSEPTHQRPSWQDVEASCTRFLPRAAELLNDKDFVLTVLSMNGTHSLPGLLGAVAECQTWFPGLAETVNKWRCCPPFP